MNNKIDVDWLLDKSNKLSDTIRKRGYTAISIDSFESIIKTFIIKYYQENSVPKEEK